MRRRSWKKRLAFTDRVSNLTYERLCQDSGYWGSCALGESLGFETSSALGFYLDGCSCEDERQWWWSIPNVSLKELKRRGLHFHQAITKKQWALARKDLAFITARVQQYRRKWRKGVKDMTKTVAALCVIGLLTAACSLESPVVRSIQSKDGSLLVTSCHRGLPPGKGGNIVTGLTEECGEYTVAVK